MAKLSKTADVLLGYLTDALRQHDVCNGAKVTRVFESVDKNSNWMRNA